MNILILLFVVWLVYFFPLVIEDMKKRRRLRDGIPERWPPTIEESNALRKRNPKIHHRLMNKMYYYW